MIISMSEEIIIGLVFIASATPAFVGALILFLKDKAFSTALLLVGALAYFLMGIGWVANNYWKPWQGTFLARFIDCQMMSCIYAMMICFPVGLLWYALRRKSAQRTKTSSIG